MCTLCADFINRSYYQKHDSIYHLSATKLRKEEHSNDFVNDWKPNLANMFANKNL